MSKSYMNIEKQCLESLHNGNKNVCNFVKDGYRYISESHTVFVLPESLYEIGGTFVQYPNSEKFVNSIYNLVEKHRKTVDLYPLQASHESVITRGYTASKMESYFTGDEVWIQNKFLKLFEPFDPEFCVYPKFDQEINPIVVMSESAFIGLVMPMHITDEFKAKKEQPKLEVVDE